MLEQLEQEPKKGQEAKTTKEKTNSGQPHANRPKSRQKARADTRSNTKIEIHAVTQPGQCDEWTERNEWDECQWYEWDEFDEQCRGADTRAHGFVLRTTATEGTSCMWCPARPQSLMHPVENRSTTPSEMKRRKYDLWEKRRLSCQSSRHAWGSENQSQRISGHSWHEWRRYSWIVRSTWWVESRN